MISEEDAMTTYEYEWYYKILPILNKWPMDKNRIKDGKKVNRGFVYSSGQNKEWMTIEQLRKYLKFPDYRELQELNI